MARRPGAAVDVLPYGAPPRRESACVAYMVLLGFVALGVAVGRGPAAVFLGGLFVALARPDLLPCTRASRHASERAWPPSDDASVGRLLEAQQSSQLAVQSELEAARQSAREARAYAKDVEAELSRRVQDRRWQADKEQRALQLCGEAQQARELCEAHLRRELAHGALLEARISRLVAHGAPEKAPPDERVVEALQAEVRQLHGELRCCKSALAAAEESVRQEQRASKEQAGARPDPAWEAEMEELRLANRELELQVEAALASAEDALAQAKAAAARAEQMGEELGELRLERDAQHRSSEESERRLEAAQRERDESAARADGLAARAAELASERDESAARADELRTRVVELTYTLEGLRSTLDGARRQTEQAQLEAEASAAQASEVSAELKAVRQAHAERDRSRAPSGDEICPEQVGARPDPAWEAEMEELRLANRELELQIEEMRGNAQTRWASKLAEQLQKLQERHDYLQLERSCLAREFQREHDELAELRGEVCRVSDLWRHDAGLCERLETTLKDSYARYDGKDALSSFASDVDPKGKAQHDEASAIDALGSLLQRTIMEVPPDQRQNLRRQLLRCFHPDRNPATEVATRITQILNETE